MYTQKMNNYDAITINGQNFVSHIQRVALNRGFTVSCSDSTNGMSLPPCNHKVLP